MYYQSSSEIQADGLQTLYLMNPNNYVAYSDTQTNMLFSSSSSAAAVMPHAPLHHAQHFMGIPLSHDPSRPLPPPALAQQHDIPTAPIPRLHYNMWGLLDQPPQETPRGLSLSLSAHRQTGFDKSPVSGDHDFPTSVGIMSPKNCSSPSLTTTESNGLNTMQGAIMGSKYLKVAQELLDGVVNVGNDLPEARKDKAKAVKDTGATHRADTETGIKSELTTAQRQEIQMKKSKLNSMLDEVEQRCRQYHQQMQIVVATFKQAAGSGSARAYTQLALKTILKQFRCLKSTIASQIKALNKSLGEEETSDHKLEGSRLKFVDTQLRQQRALQQLGMGQNNAWRPQRGLPERAVSVLRSWLFEHFLHPYPKDMDKQILAKQTGLTRSQVSNWFINARVRLWKPMVEEMYLEETKNQQDTDKKTARPAPSPPPEISASTLTTASPMGPSRTNLAHLINTDNLQLEKSPKKPRNAINPSADNQMEGGYQTNVVKFSTGNYLSMAAAANVNRYGIGELDQQLAAAAGFQGNSFSLSLALQPTESSQFLSHRNFEFGTRIESGVVEGGAASHPSSSIGYEILDFQNRKPFPAQLLPDFVA